ncbi:SAM-dependent methyltransferase [Reticulibacter mediterranei]|uniref:SAM-dependent methyltransferase n=1 Tax=Reticulibacter mediterranei TaxID=2778369 RepID=A0A8J3N1F4_9CHLR|nr:class I SAM-dependent methyltransferase [Reticulibacter mediterranei]GHO93937.1 SAM-dependent methyltransferase [Reticulibacter mediterranei]
MLRSQQEGFEQLYQGQDAPEIGLLHEGLPAWEVGYPQPAFQQLVQQEKIKGPILDIGCGTGDATLYLAEQGYEAWGVDFSPTAIQLAREKAAQRAVQATFHVGDALNLQALSSRFETIIDSGLFHTFSDEMRQPFVESLESVLRKGGHYYLLCFNDQPPLPVKFPRSISQQEIYETFQTGWHVQDIQPTLFIIRPFPAGLPAWIATLVYTG